MLKSILLLLLCASGVQAASFKLDTVGDIGNIPDRTNNTHGYGRVDYYYRIADKPVSNADYAEFLNATAVSGKTDTFDDRMAIERSGNPGQYTYKAKAQTANDPITFVSYINAAEYCNWLSHGNVYDVVDEQVTRRKVTAPESSEVFFLPSYNEWYKARYYKDGKYSYPAPLKIAEMLESRHLAWYRIAVGSSSDLQKYTVCNNYTSSVSGKSEDNLRLPDVGFRVASMPVVHVCPDLNKQNNFFYLDNKKLSVRLRSAVADKAQMSLIIKDYWGKEIKKITRDVNLTPGTTAIDIDPTVTSPGYYTLTADLSINKKTVQHDDIPFVMMDKKDSIKRTVESGFGLCIHIDRMLNCWGRMAPKDYIHMLDATNVSWLRTDWPWEYATELFLKNGYHILAFFPYWNNYKKFDSPYTETELSKKWGKYNIPRELSSYAEQCYKFIKEYPQIKYWEVGNEPHAWGISPYDYAQLCKVAYKVAKMTDPSSFVVLGDSNHIHKSVIAEGDTIDYCDSVAIHNYGFFKDYPEGVIGRMNSLRKQLARCGDAKKPIWVTETSGCGYWNHIYPGNTRAERYLYQALDMPKKLAGSMAVGADKVFIYEFMDTDVNSTEGEFGIVRADFLPKPAVMSYRTTASLLHDSKYEATIKMPKEFTGYLFKNAATSTAIMWKEDEPATLVRRIRIDVPLIKFSEPQNLSFKAEGQVFLVDIMGRRTELEVADGKVNVPVNEFPVFVTGNVKYEFAAAPEEKIVPLEKKEALIHIIPNPTQVSGANDLHNLQHVVQMKLEREVPQNIEIRVHNLTKHEISGEAYLDTPTSNSDEGWVVKPQSKKLTINPESTATIPFNVLIGKRPYTGTGPYILTAVFKTAKETYRHNAIVYQVPHKEQNVSAATSPVKSPVNQQFDKAIGSEPYSVKPDSKVKTSYKNSFGKDNSFEVMIEAGRKSVELNINASPVIGKSDSLDGVVKFSLYPIADTKITKVSIRLVDAQDEVFQFSKQRSVPNKKWNPFSFNLESEKPKGNWGKNKNNKIDFPVKLRSIVIDYNGAEAKFYVDRVEYLQEN